MRRLLSGSIVYRKMLSVVLGLVVTLSVITLTTIPFTKLQADAQTYYLDPQNGNDNNPGTAAEPWQTIPQAIRSIAAGDTLIFKQGIYRLDSTQTYEFGPSGTDVSHKTTFKAADGARAIITGYDDKPVVIHLMAYMHVDGLWFGGTWDTTTGVDAAGHGTSADPIFVLGGPLNDVINCTFFGYSQTGTGFDYLLFQGNRSVLTGSGDLSHGIYLAGQDNDTYHNHAIIDNNIFLGKVFPNPNYGKVADVPDTLIFGYGIQSWHNHNNNIITRNFVAQHIANAIDANDAADDVRSELIANNFWWKNGRDDGYPHGFYLSSHINYFDNLGGPRGGVASKDIQQTTKDNSFKTNAFTLGSVNHLLPDAPSVDTPGPLNLTEDQVAAAVGTTPAGIDDAIAKLQDSFAIGVNGRTMDALLNDQNVEGNFARLHFQTPPDSPLYHKGYAWFNPTDPTKPTTSTMCMNIGPGADMPASAGDFWAAFRALGMQDYGDHLEPYKADYPTYPYPPDSVPNTATAIPCAGS